MNYLVLYLVSLAVCLLGFKKYLYFISIGYGYSVAAIGVAMLAIYINELTSVTVIATLLAIAYGLRLGTFLLLREVKSGSYNEKMKTEIKSGDGISFVAKIAMWISCPLLYFAQISPVVFRLENKADSTIVSYIGVFVMALGIIVESVADAEKSKAKKINPKRFCDTGLYKLVRCPNYLGEVLFWTGVFVTGIDSMNSALQWIFALLGYVCIVYIMFGGARRLEIRQDKYYGGDSEYIEYTKKTPILLPFVPLYSVKKYKWLKG